MLFLTSHLRLHLRQIPHQKQRLLGSWSRSKPNCEELITAILKKNKAAAIKPPKINEHMWIFVNALIENPTFDSQTKETMTLLASKFGSNPTLSEEFMKKGVVCYAYDST